LRVSFDVSLFTSGEKDVIVGCYHSVLLSILSPYVTSSLHSKGFTLTLTKVGILNGLVFGEDPPSLLGNSTYPALKATNIKILSTAFENP
jgi:hypothetical protein